MESEAFLAGHWKNFDELESNLSVQELNEIINAIRKKDHEDKKFFAAIQGIELDEESKDSSDISDLKNARVASQEGFGLNEGLGFVEL